MNPSRLPDCFRRRFGIPLAVGVLVLAYATLTRFALLAKSAGDIGPDPLGILAALGLGFLYDLAAASFFAAPFALYSLLAPARWLGSRAQRVGVLVAFVVLAFALGFVAISEWLFWDEFSTRFNFIAVDYLVYTREVLGNIRESYPVPKLVGAAFAVALGLALLFRRRLAVLSSEDSPRRSRLAWGAALLAAQLVATTVLSDGDREVIANRYLQELAGDGPYAFFAAVRSSEIDFAKLYARVDEREAFVRLRGLLTTPDAKFVSHDVHDLRRRITHAGPEKRLNVVLVSVESLSAEFLGVFGNREGLTPNLDRLAREGLLFTELYATGTRTVRGLEALALSVPPTPGQSIVKRPDNAGLFSLASVFNARGYDSKYVYGGYGYFDNMNAFFGANGYAVVDRTAIPAADIHHENIWGVADEDLFAQTLREADASHAAGRRFFLHVMTTSNHRPFTYPEGRIDIPSGKSRQGAVKYTDWALGKLVADARTRPWFDDTVFLIVADHCAASAGKTDLPLERYHIPLVVYAPKHVEPARFERLASQIDIAPTLLGLLNFNYESRFFGYDMFALEPGRERIFVGTYQNLGFVRDDDLVILAPGSRSKVEHRSGEGDDPDDDEARNEAIAWYEGAALAFRRGLLRIGPIAAAPSQAAIAPR
ncbi:MAG: LTA synthase family protein [Burkholderiales bacterium]|jgi:phosphoglycerol transferase MdoB-like AlkP superfamily enzyme|nr:LTA synthase family protein [Burkholderiales bacterium]